jgi:hypothetical protein
MKDRPAANTVDGNAVDQVRLPGGLSRTHGSSEKTEGAGLYGGIAKPPNVDADPTGHIHWQKCYRDLWELKVSFEKQHNR